MKLEDILPYIRQGRRYRYGNHQPWNIKMESLWHHTYAELEGDKWELEPEYITLKVTEEEFLRSLCKWMGNPVRSGAGLLHELKDLSEGR